MPAPFWDLYSRDMFVPTGFSSLSGILDRDDSQLVGRLKLV